MMFGSPAYRAWLDMLSKVNGSKATVLWLSFHNFFEDMGPPPHDEAKVELIDPTGDYDRHNCRWSK